MLMEASGPFGPLSTVISVSGKSLICFLLDLTKVTNSWEEDDTGKGHFLSNPERRHGVHMIGHGGC